jgi:hypothetical protein
MPGSPAWHVKTYGIFETTLGDQAVFITKALGRYLVHDDQGSRIGSGDTPGLAMLSATAFGGVHVSLDDDEGEEEV